MVRYYSNGSGYPGAPADADFIILSVTVDKVHCDTFIHDWLYQNANDKIKNAIIQYEQSLGMCDED